MPTDEYGDKWAWYVFSCMCSNQTVASDFPSLVYLHNQYPPRTISAPTDRLCSEPCIRGHRSTRCEHFDRYMMRVRRPGRPLAVCPHSSESCQCTPEKVIMVRIPKGWEPAYTFFKLWLTSKISIWLSLYQGRELPEIDDTPSPCRQNRQNIEEQSKSSVLAPPRPFCTHWGATKWILNGRSATCTNSIQWLRLRTSWTGFIDEVIRTPTAELSGSKYEFGAAIRQWRSRNERKPQWQFSKFPTYPGPRVELPRATSFTPL